MREHKNGEIRLLASPASPSLPPSSPSSSSSSSSPSFRKKSSPSSCQKARALESRTTRRLWQSDFCQTMGTAAAHRRPRSAVARSSKPQRNDNDEEPHHVILGQSAPPPLPPRRSTQGRTPLRRPGPRSPPPATRTPLRSPERGFSHGKLRHTRHASREGVGFRRR